MVAGELLINLERDVSQITRVCISDIKVSHIDSQVAESWIETIVFGEILPFVSQMEEKILIGKSSTYLFKD